MTRPPGGAEGAGELTLVVETDTSVYLRTVPAATPLDPTLRRGDAAELATRNAAAAGGLADFVYPGARQRVGSGNREIGDGLIIVGDHGVVIQVKSRDAEGQTEQARERAWVDKKIGDALRQAKGTITLLRRRPFDLVNGRGRTVTIDGNRLSWTVLVVIDHDAAPDGITPPGQAGPTPAVVMLRRDWEFLFDQLQSTSAVVHYLTRRAGDPVELGHELVRYYELAEADANTPSGALDYSLAGAGTFQWSTPLLPRTPAGLDDQTGYGMFRLILEDLADVAAAHPAEVLDFLAAVDTVPVAQRAGLGRLLHEQLEAAEQVEPGDIRWSLRRVLSPGLQLAFGVTSMTSELVRQAFSTWVQLRHYQLSQAAPEPFGTTIGVLLSRRTDDIRDWDTTLVALEGPIQIDPETLQVWERIWPRDTPARPADPIEDGRV